METEDFYSRVRSVQDTEANAVSEEEHDEIASSSEEMLEFSPGI
jgi:hypothetical protein